MAGSGSDHLRNGVVGDTAECHGKRPGRLCLFAGGGKGTGGGHADLEREVHADRHDGLHHRDSDPDADREPGEQSGIPAEAVP